MESNAVGCACPPDIGLPTNAAKYLCCKFALDLNDKQADVPDSPLASRHAVIRIPQVVGGPAWIDDHANS